MRGFTSYLMRQQRRDDPVGDLARDAAQDAYWPDGRGGKGRYAHYLEQQGACRGAMTALERAWGEYTGAPSSRCGGRTIGR